MEIKFKFKIGQKVVNQFNEVAFINMAGIDHHEKEVYFIDLPGGKGSWEPVEKLSEA